MSDHHSHEAHVPDPNDPQAWARYVEDFRQSAHNSVEWIAEYLGNIRSYPVLPTMHPGELIDALPTHAPEQGESFDSILDDFRSTILPAVTQWNHPGFMAYFGTTASTPGILAELLIAAMNTNGLHWKTSPAVAELEQVALGWLRQWLGLPPEFFGIIYDTASTSTMHALICAREFAQPESREQGYRGNLVVYTSEQAHSSVEKGAMAIGIGQKNVRKVPTDAQFRMKADALRSLIEADRSAGLQPCCIVATIGTTSTTSVDPVAECAQLAEDFGLWLHVDCAYAGPCALLPECAEHFAGIERAHSVVTNPHKWLMTPMDLSAFYTRKPRDSAPGALAGARVPARLRRPARRASDGLRRAARPSLPRTQTVVHPALLRTRRRDGISPPPQPTRPRIRRHGSMPTNASSASRPFPSPWSASACAAATTETKRCSKR